MVIDLQRCVGCDACALACKQAYGTLKGTWWNKVLRDEIGTYPNARIRIMPVLCNHCKSAPCVKACPTGASNKQKDGIATVDQEKCVGCRYCMTACPYDARSYNYTKPVSYSLDGKPTVHEKAHQDTHQRGTVGKCNFCSERLEEGKRPFCAQSCPTEARIFGDLDDPNSQIFKLVAQSGGYQLLAHLGTQPSIYYLN